jgi:hypothetical protein
MRRIPDWTSLDAAARQRWRTSARERASELNTELNAFVEIEASKVRLGRTLDAMPYAAKDMLRTPSHQPSGGLAGAGELGIVGNSDLLDRLDEAGADRIGFTQMTELAYEPSGFNASRGRVKNPWSLDRVPRGSSSIRDVRSPVANGGKADEICSGRVLLSLTPSRHLGHCVGVDVKQYSSLLGPTSADPKGKL